MNAAIKVGKTGSFTVGTNEAEPIINYKTPTIIGEKFGVIIEKGGEFNFYDGIIKVPEGNTTIEGEVIKTPRGYRVINGEETTQDVKYETAYLGRADVEIEINNTEYTYTGEEITPEIRVLDKDTVLVEGEDYDVTYSNNKDVGTATLTINLKGNYDGTITKEFTIQKANMNVEVINYNGTYDGKSHTITLQTSPSDNISIYYSTNTELTNSNYTTEGNAVIPSRTFAGTDTVYYYIHDTSGNYNDYSSNENNKNGKIQINAKTMLSEEITAQLDETTYTYNGKDKEPIPFIKDGNTTLIVGNDYTINYEDNKNAGTAKAIITGTGNYSGELELTFTINKKKLTPEVTVKNKTYDASSIAPCEISLNGVVEEDDVTVTSSSSTFENSTVGTNKTVTITGITLQGEDSINYELEETTVTTRADIIPKELIATYVSETIEYGETPRLEVTVTGFEGDETAETAAGYNDPKVTNTYTEIGAHELKPTGGTATNYSFKYVSGILTIEAHSNVTVTLSQTSYTYDGNAKTPTVTVKDNETGDTVSTENYTVTYTNNINAGTAIAQVNLKGIYTGTVTTTFTINRANRTITLDDTLDDTQYVGKGANKNVTFTYTGNSDVTATVASSATATVSATMTDGDKGGTVKITGVESGTATVTVTVPEDTNYNKATKTINVTVTDFTIEPTTGTIAKGETIEITPTILPTSIVDTAAGTTISWNSSNVNVATVSNTFTTKGAKITVTGVADGTATITATLNGQSKTAIITVKSVASTTIGSNTTYYTTVQKAIDAAGTNGATVKLLYSGSRAEAVTVAEGQNIELNTNGATLTAQKGTLKNYGTLIINGNGFIVGNGSENNSTINNYGTLTLETVNVSSTNYRAIYNHEDGKLTIDGATVTAANYAIYNIGTSNTTSAPAVKVTKGTVQSTGAETIYNNSAGIIYLAGGTIDQTESNSCIYNDSTGTIQVSGATITHSATDGAALNNGSTGTIKVTSGNITSTSNEAIYNSVAGTITVTGGTISGTYGIYNNAGGTITIGTNEATPSVSVTTPSITGREAGITVGTGTFNFYDGIIMGQAGKSIEGTVTKTPDGYVVVKGSKTVDGTTYETSVLGPSAPVVTAKLGHSGGAEYTSGTWTKEKVYVSLKSTDVGAGITQYEWRDGTVWKTEYLEISDNIGEIRFSGNRNTTIYFRAKDANGVYSETSSIIIRKEDTEPTITVSPASATTCKTKSVTITVKDEGGSELLSSNSYQYYLSSSSTELSDGSWKKYTSGTAFSIGSGITGTRYLFVKRVSDNAGNVSTSNGTEVAVNNVTYQRFGSYVFDNTKPTAIINTESMYVTDGVVTRLDGVNNANGSHGTSTTWADISGNSKDGTIMDGTWGVNYLEFNGTSSWVDLGVMNSNYQTLEATFSPYVVPTEESCIIGNWETGGGGIQIDDNGYIRGSYYIGEHYETITSQVKVVVGNKYHVAVTYNGSAVILYVNGVEQGKILVSGKIKVPENSTVMALGVNPNGSKAASGFFKGTIYNAAVYNKALTAAQVKINADAGKALAGGPTNASSITYTIRFSEEVTGFTTNNITVTNGTKGTPATVTEGRVYNVEVTTVANQDNTQTITLTANGCTDSAGNGIAATSKAVVIDRVAPIVTLSTNGGTYDITPGNTTVLVSTTPTVSDTGSGIAGLSYAWSTSSSTEPSEWTEFTSGTAITKSLLGGNEYLWTNVIDNAGNRAINVKTPIVFTAKYQVVFDANGGTGGPSTVSKVHETALTLSSTKPTKAGYTFEEWNTKADGTGYSYAPGASYTEDSAVTLYAIWTINNYTITWDKNYLDSSLWTDTYLTNKYSYATTAPTSKITVSDNTAKYGQYIEFTMSAGAGGPYYSTPSELTVGKEYTWSIFVKASRNLTLNNMGQEQGGRKSVNVTTAWQKVTYTFTATNAQHKAFTFYNSAGWQEGDKLYIHSLEIMEGTPTNTTVSKTYNTALGTLTTPTRTGYTFQGWYTAPTGGETISDTTKVPAEDTTYYARWTANAYKVTANSNGGTIPAITGWTIASGNATATKNVVYGSIYETLPTPTKTGYTFAGWNGKNLFNKNATPINASTYIKGDGTTASNAEYSLYQVSIKPNTTYTITNSGGSDAPGYAIYDSSGTRVAGANYAKTKVITFTTPGAASYIKFSVVTDSTYREDKDTFQLEEGNKATAYEPYFVTSTTEVTTAGAHTLTAQWTVKKVEVTFMRNTTSSDTTSNKQTFTYGVSGQSFSAKGWTKTGYTLAGWSTNKDATSKEYGVTSGVTDSWINSNSPSITLYAVWTINKLTIRIHMNGGTLANSHGSTIGANSSNYITVNDSTTIHTINYGGKLGTDGLANMNNSSYINITRTGYHVVSGSEYNTKADGTGTTFNQTSAYEASDFADLSAGSKTVDLYVKWVVNTYKVKYNGNGSTGGSTAESTHTYGVAKNLTANGFTKTGYLFAGWNTKADGTGTAYTNKQSVSNLTATNNGTVTLYAQWKGIGDTVNYTTKLNDVTLDNWKVFYKEGNYVYLILADYLPNSAVNISGIQKSGDYVVYSTTDRKHLINAMTTKNNWKSLLKGSINGKSFDYTSTSTTDTNIYANGSPTLDLYVKSWNEKYPDNKLYTAKNTGMSDSLDGYYVGTSANPKISIENMSSTPGYSDTLYYPHTSPWNSTYGYLLASPSADSTLDVMNVYCNGNVSSNTYDYTNRAFRPIVCLPSSVLE